MRYGSDAKLLDILERALPLAKGKRNELSPRTLPLGGAARRLWIGFHDHIERRIGGGGELEPVRGLANKLPEHAARLAATLTLVRDNDAGEIVSGEMESGILLAQHYAAEALRLFSAGCVPLELRLAMQLLQWLRSWGNNPVSLVDIYQRGPNPFRVKATAERSIKVLESHGHVVRIDGGAEIAGNWRRDVWRLIPEV